MSKHLFVATIETRVVIQFEETTPVGGKETTPEEYAAWQALTASGFTSGREVNDKLEEGGYDEHLIVGRGKVRSLARVDRGGPFVEPDWYKTDAAKAS